MCKPRPCVSIPRPYQTGSNTRSINDHILVCSYHNIIIIVVIFFGRFDRLTVLHDRMRARSGCVCFQDTTRRLVRSPARTISINVTLSPHFEFFEFPFDPCLCLAQLVIDLVLLLRGRLPRKIVLNELASVKQGEGVSVQHVALPLSVETAPRQASWYASFASVEKRSELALTQIAEALTTFSSNTICSAMRIL